MPASFFQVIVIGLLFIIAAAFFPPLLLIIPLVLFGLLLNGLASLFKGKPTPPPIRNNIVPNKPTRPATPRAILEAERQWQIDDAARRQSRARAGAEFTAIVNRGLEGGMTPANLEAFLKANWPISFSIRDGKLNVTEEELTLIAPCIPQMREVFDQADQIAERNNP